MKKTFIQFAAQSKVGKLPKMQSRRFPGHARHGYAAYETDAPPADSPEAKILEKIKGRVAEEVRSQGLTNGAAVEKAITETLKGLNLEALRAYGTDKEGFELQVRNLAAEFAKIPKAGAAPAKVVRGAEIKRVLDANWKDIETLMRNKGTKGSVVLNVRAAVIMDMNDAITEPVDMPDDIIESFSLETFIKKRRPVEYLWELVSRRTVAAITEYKSWLEEGGEEGAFAIVAEGAVKPLMSKKLVRNFTKYRKIAGKRVYTEEFPKFRKEAFNIIEDLFNDKLMRDYNAVLVTSLLAKAATYVGTALDDQYTNPTDYHAVGAVASQMETLEFYPDLLIIHPQDKWRIGLSQNSSGDFFNASIPIYNPSGNVSMLGFRVFTSTRMDIGWAILGESGLYKVEDEPIQIRLGYGIDVVKDINGFVTDVSSDVDTNRFRIIAETFFHDWIGSEHLGSFVRFNFATVKAALLKP
jgi:hypothetical protein